MEKQKILNSINSVQSWFHKIEIAPGIVTPGVQNSVEVLSKIQLPTDLSGLRVLDIGARDGFYSFECEKRGAAEVIAVDYSSPSITGFNVAKKLLDSKVEWVTANAYNIDSLDLGKFDLILFLGVIYHLRNPYLAIDKIHDALNLGGKVIVESHIIDGGFVDKSGNWINLTDIDESLTDLSVAQIYKIGQLVNDPTSAWAPSLNTLIGMFENSGFIVESSWKHHFRGGLTASAIPMAEDHPRFIESGLWLELVSDDKVSRPEKISSVD